MKGTILKGLVCISSLQYSRGQYNGSIAPFTQENCTAELAASKQNKETCVHGCYDENTHSCFCRPGWKLSGPTDTFNWLAGVCQQSLCESNDKCMELLGFGKYSKEDKYRNEEATCPFYHWNCQCSWTMAFEGYATDEAKCMDPMFLISFSGIDVTMWCLRNLWMGFLFFFIILLPFGQNHVRCQHRDPDMFKVFHRLGILTLVGWDHRCNGRCSRETHPEMWKYYYRYAWSLYVLDLFIWVYLTLLVGLATSLVIWAIAVVIVIILAIIIAVIVGLCGALMACAGDGGGGDCGLESCSCEGGQSCECCGNCGGCCDINAGDIWLWNSTFSYDVVYWGNGPNNCCCECPRCANCCVILKPVAWLIHKLPRNPPNMWGGACGYRCLKTSQDRSDNGLDVYEAGTSRFIDFLGALRRGEDLHGQEEWRSRIWEFLMYLDENGNRLQTPNTPLTAPPQHTFNRSQTSRLRPIDLNRLEQGPVTHNGHLQYMLGHRGRRIALVDTDKSFERNGENLIVENSWQDYQKGECWICRENQSTWHLWTSCGHLFCQGCSSEMIRRGMPCPLCRQISPVIKIGKKAYQPPSLPSAV